MLHDVETLFRMVQRLNNGWHCDICSKISTMIQVIEHSITNDLYLDLHEGNLLVSRREASHITRQSVTSSVYCPTPNRGCFRWSNRAGLNTGCQSIPIA